MENSYRLDIAFYRGEVGEEVPFPPFQGQDVGPRLDGLVTTPSDFAHVQEEGTIKLETQRTHEWEFLVGLAITGSAVFITGVLSELGKRTAAWLIDQVHTLKTGSQPEVRVGKNVVRIDPAAASQMEVAVVAVLAQGIESSVQVQVIIEPRR